ncbi:hypothetical protein [Curtobacterium sp. MCSS17_015]|uniref:hypothetical protein n=1 Tax=Curtobacterium sp. MCSS17_015 TaxID=2175666 RepID=UPI000DA70E39|nr:hypothetical protein [Curtobacterium sp. MCSS17_015]WIB27843.1 hypothetical protein DEJ18_07060 [Curtobacterium sp. MCSS17_015]
MVVVLAVVVVVVVALVRVLHPPVIGEEYSGAGPGTLGVDGSGDTTPTVGWVEPGRRFFVMAYGSSTCPQAPTGIDQRGTSVEVELRLQGGPACTADFGPTAYALDLPHPTGPGTVLDVTIRLDDGGTTVARLSG